MSTMQAAPSPERQLAQLERMEQCSRDFQTKAEEAVAAKQACDELLLELKKMKSELEKDAQVVAAARLDLQEREIEFEARQRGQKSAERN